MAALLVVLLLAPSFVTVTEVPPDTLQFCAGRNCTAVAFLPDVLETSYTVSRRGCTATMSVAYNCLNVGPRCQTITHTVSSCSPGGDALQAT